MEGQRLGQYEISARIGAGGMGDVWRAWDPKLQRPVAIKILKAETPDAAARILAEARAASALNHANICTVYEAGEADGRSFIAMELVDGRPLSESIPPGGLPPDTVVRYGIQIAAGLAHAHEHGVVHRDLKGQNVMLTADGKVKLIDFGIAAPTTLVQHEAVTREQASPMGSGPVGTLGYMAPEVLQGGKASASSDIWSLGVLLHEMASGHQPFDGATRTDVVTAILKETAPPLPAQVSPGLRGVVQRCLTKETGQRYRHAAAVEAALEAIQSTASVGPPVDGSSTSPSRVSWVAVAVLVAALAGAAAYLGGLFTPAPASVLQLANPTRVTGATGEESSPTWSPNGGMIAYHAGSASGGPPDIWVTQVGGGEPLNRTADHPGIDIRPQFSPDGNQIAFVSDRDGPGYYVMPTIGGDAQRVFDATLSGRPQWSPDGSELAGVSLDDDGNETIQIVSLREGRTREVSLEPLGAPAFDLSWAPDGRFFAVVEAVSNEAEVTQLWILRLADDTWFPVVDRPAEVWSPEWSSDGHRLYFVSNREGSMDLWQQELGDDGEPDGQPARVTNGVGMRVATLSADGTRLAYSKGNRVANVWRVPIRDDREVTWADAAQLTNDQAFVELLDIAPDSTRVFFSSDRSGNQDIWELTLSTGALRQMTNDPTPDWAPRVSPSGTELVFYAYRTGNRDVWTMPTRGGRPMQLTTDETDDLAPAWSPSGTEIAFASARSGNLDVWVMNVDDRELRQLTTHPATDSVPTWSPDGQWMYFLSARSGTVELWRVRTTGEDVQPVGDWTTVLGWSADGETMHVYRVTDESVWAVTEDGAPIRRITGDGGFLGGGRPGRPIVYQVTDGHDLYFAWREFLGDIWVMDVVGSQ